MSFVKINQYYINLDSIAYVAEEDNQLFVHFTDASGITDMSCSVDIGSPQAASLLKALATRLP